MNRVRQCTTRIVFVLRVRLLLFISAETADSCRKRTLFGLKLSEPPASDSTGFASPVTANLKLISRVPPDHGPGCLPVPDGLAGMVARRRRATNWPRRLGNAKLGKGPISFDISNKTGVLAEARRGAGSGLTPRASSRKKRLSASAPRRPRPDPESLPRRRLVSRACKQTGDGEAAARGM